MKGGARTGAGVLAGVALCLAAHSMTPENEYGNIAARNAFGLVRASEHTPITNQPPALPRITLTGITTILHDKRVLLKVEWPTRPPEPVKVEFMILAEGEGQGDLEVLQVDVERGEVRLRVSGVVTTLTMDRDGAKLPGTPLPSPLSRRGDTLSMPPLPPGLNAGGNPPH
jgi:hypothetical protein